MDQQYCLRWNNHSVNMLNVFDQLLQNEEFTDVTLAVEGGSIKCHKVVLAACSFYFQSLFLDLPCKHPIVVLKDVRFSEIKALLEYMYRGEVKVAQEQMSALFKLAQILKVKGLVNETASAKQEDVEMPMSPSQAISTSTGIGSMVHSREHVPSPHSTAGGHDVYGDDRDRIETSVPMWEVPRLPLHSSSTLAAATIAVAAAAAATSHSSAAYSPHSAAALSGSSSHDSFETSSSSSTMRRNKKLLHQTSLLMNRDTPILRTVLGQGHADSSQMMLKPEPSFEGHYLSGSTCLANDEKRSNAEMMHGVDTVHSPYADASTADEESKQQPLSQSHSKDMKPGIANYVLSTKPEWKRYKQYTKEDIVAAIEAVKHGTSAVQAARKHGVPSRTLYDKVKKLGIATSRPFKRTSNSRGANFPYGIGCNVNGSIYSSSLPESESSHANTSTEDVASTASVAKCKDSSPDRSKAYVGSVIADVTRCSPRHTAPVICYPNQQQDVEDEVEDLSVSRKRKSSESSTELVTIKSENPETDRDDCK